MIQISVLLAILALLTSATVGLISVSGTSVNFPNVVKALSTIFVGTGVFFALFVYLRDSQWRKSESYLKNSENLIEKAFKEFTRSLDEQGRPSGNRRRLWLDVSRLILASQRIGSFISEPSHKAIYQEVEIFWKYKFLEVLKPEYDDIFDENYFNAEHHQCRDPFEHKGSISELSLRVIYRFIKLPAGLNDPLKALPPFSRPEIDEMMRMGPRPVALLLKRSYRLQEQKNNN